MGSPLVTIAIPVFNRRELVSECLQSAIGQTYKNIEIIISDNNSDDGTMDVLRQFESSNDCVTVIAADTNDGPVKNWMRALVSARGKYVKLLFSDDLLAKDAIEKMVNAAEQHDCDVILAAAIIGKEPWVGVTRFVLAKTGRTYSVDYILLRYIFCSKLLPVSPCAYLFSTEKYICQLKRLIVIATEEQLRTGAGIDLESILMTIKDSKKFVFVDGVLTFFRHHSGSITVESGAAIKSPYDRSRQRFVSGSYGKFFASLYSAYYESRGFLRLLRDKYLIG